MRAVVEGQRHVRGAADTGERRRDPPPQRRPRGDRGSGVGDRRHRGGRRRDGDGGRMLIGSPPARRAGRALIWARIGARPGPDRRRCPSDERPPSGSNASGHGSARHLASVGTSVAWTPRPEACSACAFVTPWPGSGRYATTGTPHAIASSAVIPPAFVTTTSHAPINAGISVGPADRRAVAPVAPSRRRKVSLWPHAMTGIASPVRATSRAVAATEPTPHDPEEMRASRPRSGSPYRRRTSRRSCGAQGHEPARRPRAARRTVTPVRPGRSGLGRGRDACGARCRSTASRHPERVHRQVGQERRPPAPAGRADAARRATRLARG